MRWGLVVRVDEGQETSKLIGDDHPSDSARKDVQRKREKHRVKKGGGSDDGRAVLILLLFLSS